MTPAIPPVRVRLRDVPAVAGLHWIRRGFRTFFRRPAGFVGLFGLVLLTMIVLKLTPPVLQVFALVLMPLVSLGFMVATSEVLDDLPIRPGVFWAPMKLGPAARRALINIGLVYVVVLLLNLVLGNQIDGGESLKWMEKMSTPTADGRMPDPAPLSGPGWAALMLNLFGVALVSVPLWHAPALVHWGRHGAAQAMFSSVVAIWRTRAAFTTYLLGWCAVGLAFTLGGAVLALVFNNVALGATLMMPVAAGLSAIFYVSIWFGFADTFEISARAS